jgi:hypothetical protein
MATAIAINRLYFLSRCPFCRVRDMQTRAIRERLAVLAGSWEEVAAEACLPYDWVFAFAVGKLTGPLDRVQLLDEALARRWASPEVAPARGSPGEPLPR